MLLDNYMLPNFIIAGVNKAGTTSIYTYLKAHPQVCGSSVKEVMFFNKYYTGKRANDLQNYSAYFKECDINKTKVIFEATPSYLFGGKKIADRISEVIPNTKLLFVLRDPVSCIYSKYNFAVYKRGDIDGHKVSFEEYLHRCIQYSDEGQSRNLQGIKFPWLLNAVEKGKYVNDLEEYYKVFSKKNIKVMFFEELQDNVLSFLEDLCVYLDVDNGFYSNYEFNKENTTYIPKNKMFHNTCSKLYMMVEPYMRRNPNFKRNITSFYKSINQRDDRYAPMKDTSREFLREYYRESNSRLADLLNDQSHPGWLKNATN